MCAIKMDTIYIPIHQLPTEVVNDTADLLIANCLLLTASVLNRSVDV